MALQGFSLLEKNTSLRLPSIGFDHFIAWVALRETMHIYNTRTTLRTPYIYTIHEQH